MSTKLIFPSFLLLFLAACTLQLHKPQKTAQTDIPGISQVAGTIAPYFTTTSTLIPTLGLTPTNALTSTPVLLPSFTATIDNFQRIHFDERLWTHFTNKDGLPDNFVSSIAIAPDQSVWLGLWEDYISHFDGETWESYSLPTDWGDNYILCVFVNKAGDVWVGTEGNGAYRFDGKEWAHYAEEEGLTDSRVYSFLNAYDGSMWVGAEMNLYRYDGNTWKSYRSDKSPFYGLLSVSDIETTPDGILWFAAAGDLYSFDGENWKSYSSMWDFHIEYGGFGDIEIAQDNTLWISKPGDGIFHFFTDGSKKFLDVPGMSDYRIISSIEISSNGSVWVSSYEKENNTLRKWDGKNWIIYDQLPFDLVWDMKVAPDDSIWFATRTGAYRFTPEG